MADVATLGLRIRADGLVEVMRGLDNITVSGKKAETQANRINSSLLVLAQQATGANPAIARLLSTLGQLGIGSPVMVGVLGGVAAVGAAYRLLTKDTREAREENEKYSESLKKAEQARRAATIPGRREALAEVTARRDTAMERRARAERDMAAADMAGPLFPVSYARAKKELADARSAVDQLTTAVRRQKEELEAAEEAWAKTWEKKQTIKEMEFTIASPETIQRVRLLTAELARLKMEVDTYAEFRLPSAQSALLGGTVAGLTVGGRTPGVGFQQMTGPIRYPTADYLRSTSTTGRAGAGTNWAQIAQIGGGIILGSGLAGNGATAAGLSGGLSGAAQGAMLGSVVPGIGTAVGAVVGGVAGLVSGLLGHGKKAREEAQRLREAQRVFDANLAMRRAELEGDQDKAAMLRLTAQHEKELADARQAGMKGTQVAALRLIQEEEKLALSRNLQKAALDELAQNERDLADARKRSAEMMEDLTVRALRAVGMSGTADRLGLQYQQRRERDAAVAGGAGAADLATLDAVQAIERQAQALNLWRDEQIAAIQGAADKQLAALEDQRELAEAALRLNEEQLRAQERTVETMRSVVDSLGRYSDSMKLGSLSPLTPLQQLAEARNQVGMLGALAMGGDASAAASIPDAVRTLLEQSSRVYGTATPQYVEEFARSQKLVDDLRERFANQLTVEEKMLAELQEHGRKLSHQIAELQTQQQTTRDWALAQIAAVNQAHAEQMAQFVAMVRELFGIEDNTGDTATNTGEAYRAALQEVSNLNAYIENQRSQNASREQNYVDQINALNDRIRQLENQLNGGWGGGGGGGGYNPEDDPNWPGLFEGLGLEIAAVRSEIQGLRADTRVAYENMEG